VKVERRPKNMRRNPRCSGSKPNLGDERRNSKLAEFVMLPETSATARRIRRGRISVFWSRRKMFPKVRNIVLESEADFSIFVVGGVVVVVSVATVVGFFFQKKKNDDNVEERGDGSDQGRRVISEPSSKDTSQGGRDEKTDPKHGICHAEFARLVSRWYDVRDVGQGSY